MNIWNYWRRCCSSSSIREKYLVNHSRASHFRPMLFNDDIVLRRAARFGNDLINRDTDSMFW
jgi:hypothetical protein